MSQQRDPFGGFTKATIPLVRSNAVNPVIDLTVNDTGHTFMVVADPEDEFPMPEDPNYWRAIITRAQEIGLARGLLVNVVDLSNLPDEE
jgi:hypothetical protein